MKKILFLEYDFDYGGRQKVSLDILNSLVTSGEFQVDLCLLFPGGIWDAMIPQAVNRVNIFDIPIDDVQRIIFKADQKYSVSANIKNRHFLRSLRLLFNGSFRKNRHLRYGQVYNHIKQDKYDYAICPSLTASSIVTAIIAKVNASVKYAWLHRSFCAFKDKKKFNLPQEAVKSHINHDVDLLSIFDKIICVSGSIKKLFDYYFPYLADRSVVMYNALDTERILRLSQEGVNDIPNGELKIATVGRAEYEKGLHIMLDAAKRLKNNGYKFTWYFVGNGSLLEKSKVQVKKFGIEDIVFFLGSKDNPYPYIKACDIYIQPSLTEAYSTTVNEARILGKPVIATRFSGISEQIVSGTNGLICDISGKALAEAIKTAIDDGRWKTFAKNAAYPNRQEKEKMFDVKKLIS